MKIPTLAEMAKRQIIEDVQECKSLLTQLPIRYSDLIRQLHERLTRIERNAQ